MNYSQLLENQSSKVTFTDEFWKSGKQQSSRKDIHNYNGKHVNLKHVADSIRMR